MSEVDEAFAAAPRANFVLPEYADDADLDVPLPIGYGQTISQPTTVAMMLDWLESAPGDKVLDIGSGSGWTSALLAHMVGAKGAVYAVEKVPQLVEFGRANCERLGIKNVKFYEAKAGKYGLPKHAPYNCILVSASASQLPQELLSQLKVGGKLVVPVRHDILEIIKTSEKDYDTFTHQGFAFVPLVK